MGTPPINTLLPHISYLEITASQPIKNKSKILLEEENGDTAAISSISPMGFVYFNKQITPEMLKRLNLALAELPKAFVG